MTDSIRPQSSPPGSRPVDTSLTGRPVNAAPQDAAALFRLDRPSSSDRTAPTTGTAFDGVRHQIVDGGKQGLSRDEILQAVVREELRAAFGLAAPGVMNTRVAEIVQGNPDMTRMFAQLCQLAGTDAGRTGDPSRIKD